LLQTQDAIVTHLARAMDLQLVWAEGARIKRTLVANRDAEDLALQCDAGTRTAGWIGKEAEAAYALCEQALAIDPNNVRGLMVLGIKFWVPAVLGVSGDPKGDLDRADELESKALALDPDYAWAHDLKGGVLRAEGRTEEAVAEHERALALDPSNVDAAAQLGIDYRFLGRFDKSLEYLDRAILASPYDPSLAYWYDSKAWANFGLKRYDEAIELARRSIAITPSNPNSHVALVAALASTGHESEAREALQRYLALPSSGPLKTIAAWNAHQMSQVPKQGGDPRFVEMSERSYDGLRKAGMPEGEAKTH
jgi:adenylate cyclase